MCTTRLFAIRLHGLMRKSGLGVHGKCISAASHSGKCFESVTNHLPTRYLIETWIKAMMRLQYNLLPVLLSPKWLLQTPWPSLQIRQDPGRRLQQQNWNQLHPGLETWCHPRQCSNLPQFPPVEHVRTRAGDCNMLVNWKLQISIVISVNSE